MQSDLKQDLHSLRTFLLYGYGQLLKSNSTDKDILHVVLRNEYYLNLNSL